MYSTDDEDFNEFANDNHSESQSVMSHVSSSPQSFVGGPYSVTISKPYKPVYIVFLDLAIALTFFIFSVMWYWSKLKDDDPITQIDIFIPSRIIIIWFILFVKFFADIVYLRMKFGIDMLNRSSVTPDLYWFRVWYDLIFIGGTLIIFSYYWKRKIKNLMMSDSFKIFVIVMPKLIIELVIYKISLMPAYRRSVY